MSEVTTLPITPEIFWGFSTLFAFAAVTLLVFGAMPAQSQPGWLSKAQKTLGAEALNPGLFLLAALLWGAILLILTLGLGWLLISLTFLRYDPVDPGGFRFLLAQIAGMTAVLGAVVALPVTLTRMRMAQEQTETAKAALFNTKITEAAADLHAMRQVSTPGPDGYETRWEDDITRRNAAIDRLEGLVREQPTEAGRVSRLLSTYVRELSIDYPAVELSSFDEKHNWENWKQSLTVPRSDMESAVQTLGRLAQISGVEIGSIKVDLRAANLQAMDLSKLRFRNANFAEAKLHGAVFWKTKLEGADFAHAQLQGTYFEDAKLSTVYLEEIGINEMTTMTDMELSGGLLRRVDLCNCPQFTRFLEDVYSDGSSSLPGDCT